MMKSPNFSRRAFMKGTAAAGVASGASFSIGAPAFAQSGLPDPASVLADISVGKYVRKDYRELYNMSDAPLWDPNKDWIRTVDWEAVRKAQAGKSVRFAIGAADTESAVMSSCVGPMPPEVNRWSTFLDNVRTASTISS